jgi:hypothetical protein
LDKLGNQTSVIRVQDDDVKRFEAAKKAAENGDAAAQYDLGLMYNDGRGTRTDRAEALVWIRRAADQDIGSAQRRMGDAYFDGAGVEQSYVTALQWFTRAANLNDAASQFRLGVMYDEGLGTTADARIAEDWLRKSARANIRDAELRLDKKARLLDLVSYAEQELASALDNLPTDVLRNEARDLLGKLVIVHEPLTLPALEGLRKDADRATRLLADTRTYLRVATEANREVEAIETETSSITFDAPMLQEIRAHVARVKAALRKGDYNGLLEARRKLALFYDKEKLAKLRDARSKGFASWEEYERFLAEREKLSKSGIRPKAPSTPQ